MTSIGSRIRELRKKAGLTQDELAEIIGVKRGVTISNYEKGEREPDLENIRKIAAHFNVTSDWLINGTSVITEPPVVYNAGDFHLSVELKAYLQELIDTNQFAQVAKIGKILVYAEELERKNAEMTAKLQTEKGLN